MNAAARLTLVPFCLLLAGTALFMKSESSAPGVRPGVESEKSSELRRINPVRVPANTKAASLTFNNPRRDSGAVSQTQPQPEILEFKRIKQKALRTKSDVADLARLRRDRQVLKGAFDKLSDFDSQIPERNELVSLIQDALLDPENPERPFVTEQVERLILADNLAQNRPHRRELAADKGELTLAYLDAQPARLKFLLEASAGSPSIQVIRNAVAVGERRRAESLRLIQELEHSVSN